MHFTGSVTPVGVMEVNPIESLNSVSLRSNEHDDVTLKDIEVPDDDTSNPNGKVVLVLCSFYSWLLRAATCLG